MARHKIIDGKDTLERIEGEYRKLRASGKSMSVVEFCRRAKVSPDTFTHRYKSYADKVRKIRDRGLRELPKRSPATWPRERFADYNEAAHLVTVLRKENRQLAEDQDRWKAKAERLMSMEAENERLRGALVVLRQWIVDHMEPEEARRVLKEIEESPVPDLALLERNDACQEKNSAPPFAA